MPSFDTLTEPWIPVIRSDGTAAELGLRDVLEQAPELREIRDPMPTVEFGLYRLLVALVMDAHELETLGDLGALLEAGHFGAEKVDAYLARWHDRFDLFDLAHPFLQTAAMEAREEKPLSALLPVVPSGTSALHFHHRQEDDFALCPAAAARLLTSMAPFMTAGGAGLSPSINGAPPWYVLVRGKTLFDTLCLNCCLLPLPQLGGEAPPAWRNDQASAVGRATDASLLEALTWRPRRLRLIPGGEGLCSVTGALANPVVRTMWFERGASCDFTWTDPNVAYRLADKARPLRPREQHELWRDTGPLALLRSSEYEVEHGGAKIRFERPLVVTQSAELAQQGVLPGSAELRLVIYGMRTDLKMKVFEWQRESLSLPAALVWRSPFRTEAQHAMEEAELVGARLRRAAKLAYPRAGGGNKRAFEGQTGDAERRFWSELRPHYDELLRALAGMPLEATEEVREGCRQRWRQQAAEAGGRALDDVIGDLDTDADALVRQVTARAFFRASMAKLLASAAEAEATSPNATGGRAAGTNRKKGGAGR